MLKHFRGVLPLLLAAVAGRVGAQIPVEEYAARRDSLAARIGNGVVVALGARTPIHDFGPFHQLAAFHYLTNFDEPDAGFVLIARGGKGQGTLFVVPTDARSTLRAFYYGIRPDSAATEKAYRIRTRSFTALRQVLDSVASLGLPIYHLADFEDADFAAADSLTRGRELMRDLAAKHPGLVLKDAHEIVDQLRARKSAAELAILRRAAEISSEGHRAAMLAPEPTREYELRAALEHAFTRLGGTRPAYGSIVGSGANGTQLHYMLDTGAAKLGDIVVMDAAAEYQGYAADITRTIPVSGKFTAEQRAIYQLVRDAQAAAERNSKPGMRAQAASDSSFAIRARGLAALGLIESETATFDPPWGATCSQRPVACTQAFFWMLHGISHGIGLAVHDPAQFYSGDGTFRIGDAFTIEPGIYVDQSRLDLLPDTPKNRAFIAKVRPVAGRYDKAGVRIEDDYVITEKGLERISTAPREIDEIEALMRKRQPRTVP